MYPRVALPKLTTSEEFGFYVEFYCWLDCSILVTRIPSLHKFNNKSMTSSKSPKLVLLEPYYPFHWLLKRFRNWQICSLCNCCLAFRTYWLSSLNDYYLEIWPAHNIFRGREPLFLLVFQSSGKSISFNKNLFSIDTCR